MKDALKTALEKREYTTLTPVQQEVSNPEFDNADLLVSAQTGSGKTVGFGLAIAPNILDGVEEFGRADTPLGLIIAPTRELAMQVKRELQWLYAEAGVVMASCVGGMDMRDERRALDRGAHIVVATPGRLRDHIMRSSIDLSEVRAVVLDEADEMLDLGFSEDLEFILSATPDERRTLMFSATVPKGIANLARKYQCDAIRVTTVAEKSQHSDIEYKAMEVAKHGAENAIINVLRYHEAPNAIVFANTRATVARLTTRLSNRGFSVVCLSGELSQSERSHALQSMRDGRARICVATDVAARGIDLPKLDLVVHAELPSNHETLLHRSGRTGRAGRKGTSVLVVTSGVRRKAERILKGAKVEADWGTPPTADQVLAKDHERMLQDPVWTAEVNPIHNDMIAKLLEMHGAERVAAAFLDTYSNRLSAPEEIAEYSATPPARREKKSREDFGPSAWFRLGHGRKDGVSPGQIVPMLCKAGDITKTEIGAIRIQGDHTFVELRKDATDGFMKALGASPKVEGAEIVALDGVPDFPPAPQRDFGDKPRRGGPGGGRDSKPWEKGPRGGGDRRDRGPKGGDDRRDRKPRFDPLEDNRDGGKPRRDFDKPKRDFDKPKRDFDKPKRDFDKPKRDFDKPRGEGKGEWKPKSKRAKELPEGVVKTFKKKAGKPFGKPKSDEKGGARAGASDPNVSLRAPKVGKFSSKKNKARRAAASASGKGGTAVPKRKG